MVMSLEFSPNGDELARFCFGYAVALFDTTNYRRARTFLSETEHTPQLRGFAYSPDGTMIATAEGYRGARVWNAADPGKPIPKEKRFSGVVYELYALDTPLRVLQAPIRGDRNLSVLQIGFSPDGKLLITTHANGHVKVWNTSSWTVKRELVVTDSRLGVAAFAPDSKTVMIGDANGVLHHWSLATKAEIRTLRTFEDVGDLWAVAFSPDGKTLVATVLGARPNAVIIWNTTDWIAQTESGYSSAAFSKDGKLLALGGRSHIKLIEPASRKQIRDIELPEVVRRNDEKEQDFLLRVCFVSALAFSPDGNTLAAGCSEGTVRLVKMTP
jgi:WD40 repeat protein